MIKDRIVRIKMKKNFKEQKPFSYVGKVTVWSENWIVVEAKGIMLTRQQASGVQIDDTFKMILIPRENIDHIQVLPDNFDLQNLKITTEGQQLVLIIDDKRNSFLGEMGEG
ncbi:MAG TPA: hypothetical protein PLT82_06180 [Candidatus Hydrogenedens sp.]|nr:hypothetical protein [Candidatus Hydrogenedens sp.]HOK08992.1 hypothetical protein [Candidatus Hydrogenedens sp.]HOL20660.1 hypothetical protein [Candidatus Hydrogenedens sp.]HPP58702.1 hypothetical protein [Candidatus Hydrogenedens sp.]